MAQFESSPGLLTVVQVFIYDLKDRKNMDKIWHLCACSEQGSGTRQCHSPLGHDFVGTAIPVSWPDPNLLLLTVLGCLGFILD